MSVPSSKTTVTTDRPYFEIERTSSTFGIPDIARSTGTVTYCSTSTGDSAGAAVITWTCTLVTSGTASIGRSAADRIPTITRSAVAISTTARWRSDQATMRPRRITSLSFAEAALQDRALDAEHAVDHDLFTRAQAAEDLHAARRRPTQGHGVQLE